MLRDAAAGICGAKCPRCPDVIPQILKLKNSRAVTESPDGLLDVLGLLVEDFPEAFNGRMLV